MGISNVASNLRPGICTSTTRPSAPFEGQTIYETDTGRLLIYNGSGWFLPKNMPWGILGTVQSTTSFATSATHTTFQDNGLSVSCTYGSSRKLRMTAMLRPYPNGGLQRVEYKLVRGTTDVCIFAFGTPDLSATEAPLKTIVYTFDGPAEAATATFKLQIRSAQNNTQSTCYATATTLDGPRQLTIEDIGPV